MKRIIRLLPVILIFLLLNACAAGTVPGPQAEEHTGSAVLFSGEAGIPDEILPPEGVTEIRFWFSGNENALSVMRDIISDFNSSREDYYVTLRGFDDIGDMYSELQAAVATGDSPDLTVLTRDMSLEAFRKGQTLPLNKIISGLSDYNDENYLTACFDQGFADDGTVFAIPLYGVTRIMFYNKAAFDSVGIDPEEITTWQGFAEAAAVLKRRLVCDYGWEPLWGYEVMADAALSNGGTFFSGDGMTVTINSEEWVGVWEAFRTWLHDDESMRIHSGGHGGEHRDRTISDVTDGTAGGYTGSSGDLGELDTDVIGVLPQPAWDNEHEAAPAMEALFLNVPAFSSSDEREGAFALVRYLINVPAQAKWTMGTGNIAVNRNLRTFAEYLRYIKSHPEARTPLLQSTYAFYDTYDPTNGVLFEALTLAADRVQIENISAKRALDDACRTAQAALDEALGITDGEITDAETSDAEPVAAPAGEEEP